MHTQYNRKFAKDMVIIGPGEYYATKDDTIISTLLGSCVAACLYDPVNHVAGMNHFLLAGNLNNPNSYYLSDAGRYGINAMELLINDMMKLGADKRRLKAKSFGGAHVLHTVTDTPHASIPDNNVQFIKEFLETENIQLVSQDLGGNAGRKILFFSKDFRVLMKRLDSQSARIAQKEEEELLQEQKKKLSAPTRERKNNVDFFD
jgi:chemotaxis protein CheD